MRQGRVLLDSKQWDALEQLLSNLKDFCKDPDNSLVFDKSKGAQVLEILSVEILMCIERKEQRRMKQAFEMTEQFSSVIDDPKTQQVLKECGGKMFMSEKKWDKALRQFWDCYIIMSESGSPRAITVLKYVILAQLLSQSTTDFMTQQEAQVHKGNEEIIAMLDLKDGFLNNDINKILAVTQNRKINLLADPLIN